MALGLFSFNFTINIIHPEYSEPEHKTIIPLLATSSEVFAPVRMLFQKLTINK